jgi:hypothetical protein
MFDLEQESKKNPCHTDLIMVASLIDRAPNLGGLSRTCEIFGAGKLIVNNKKIINDKGDLISEGIFYREYDKREISILLLRVVTLYLLHIFMGKTNKKLGFLYIVVFVLKS